MQPNRRLSGNDDSPNTVDGAPYPNLSHAQSALIRDLLCNKRARTERGLFVVEGARSCLDLIRRYPDSIVNLTLAARYLKEEDDRGRSIRSGLLTRQFVCTDSIFEKLTDVAAPQGMLAIVKQPRWEESRVLGAGKVLGVYGDRLRDPANVGAIIRTVAALRLSALWLSTDSADQFGPKVVRAAAGTILSIPIFRIPNPQSFLQHHCTIYSALVPSRDTMTLTDLRSVPRRLVIAVGNEGEGLDAKIVKLSAVRFAIPLAEGVDSLNVAAAVAISAFYLRDLPITS